VERIAAIAREAASYTPDLVLFGGDFLNMQTFGGGRIPPVVVARLLAPLRAPLGQLAVLGNHDTEYDAAEVAAALEQNRIEVLNDRRRTIRFEDLPLDIVGLPDTDHRALVPSREIANQTPSVPAIFLAHDPVWWTMIQPGLSLTLAGHTHGGQIRFPLLGPLSNASNARLAWSYGLIRENSKIMYVTSGIGTSFIPMRWRAPPEFVILDVSGS
jgi:predicted MPP superfamily phosphohydrolase